MKEYKTFRLNGKLLAAYSAKDEFDGEEEETRGLLAYENACEPEEIQVSVETGIPK